MIPLPALVPFRADVYVPSTTSPSLTPLAILMVMGNESVCFSMAHFLDQ
jgi:hypothetical protein